MALKESNKNRKKIITPARYNHEQVEKHLSKVLPKKECCKSHSVVVEIPKKRYNKSSCWFSFGIICLAVLLVI